VLQINESMAREMSIIFAKTSSIRRNESAKSFAIIVAYSDNGVNFRAIQSHFAIDETDRSATAPVELREQAARHTGE
jgi:hypothetical protein